MKLTGEIIRIVRMNLGVNQRKLAMTADVSGALIGHIERGERVLTDKVEQKIRKALPLTDYEIQLVVQANRTINKTKKLN